MKKKKGFIILVVLKITIKVTLYKYGETLETVTLEEEAEEFDEMINHSQLKKDIKWSSCNNDLVERVKNHDLPETYNEFSYISIEMMSHSKDYSSLFIYGLDLYQDEHNENNAHRICYSINNNYDEGSRDIYFDMDVTKLKNYIESFFD